MFAELRKNNNYLLSSKSFKSTRARSPAGCKDDAPQDANFSFSYEHFGTVLEKLGVKVTIVDSW